MVLLIMMKNKGIASMGIIAIVAIIGILVAVATPQGRGLISGALGTPTSCIDDPYNYNCVCTSELDKEPESLGIPFRYHCVQGLQPVPYGFPLDRNDPDFEAKAFDYSKQYIETNFPACAGVSDCSGEYWRQFSWNIDWAGFECRDPGSISSGQIIWKMSFYLDDGTIVTNPVYPIPEARCYL